MKIRICLALSTVGGAVSTSGGDGHYQMSALERFSRWECSGLDYLPMCLFRQTQGHFKCQHSSALQCRALKKKGNMKVYASVCSVHEVLSNKILKFHKPCIFLFAWSVHQQNMLRKSGLRPVQRNSTPHPPLEIRWSDLLVIQLLIGACGNKASGIITEFEYVVFWEQTRLETSVTPFGRPEISGCRLGKSIRTKHDLQHQGLSLVLPAKNRSGVCNNPEFMFLASEHISCPYPCWDKGLSLCHR